MEFKEFYDTIASELNDGQTIPEFVRELFINITDYEQSDDTLPERDDNTLQYYANGKRSIRKFSKSIIKHLSPSKFKAYLMTNNHDIQGRLYAAFQLDREGETYDSMANELAYLFDSVIREAATKKNLPRTKIETDTPTNDTGVPISKNTIVAAKKAERQIIHSHYNLFVIDDIGSYHFPLPFLIPKEKALTIAIQQKIREKYSTLSEEAEKEIYMFPSLFAFKNGWARNDSEPQIIYFGFVERIKREANGLLISPGYICDIKYSDISEHLKDFGIRGDKYNNEFHIEHWNIIELDLVERLRMKGYSLHL